MKPLIWFCSFFLCFGTALTPNLKVNAADEQQDNTCQRQAIVEYARQLTGIRYAYGHASPENGFDCSGFIMHVFGRFGYSLPHEAAGQMSLGERVEKRNDLLPADLVFFATSEEKNYATHVGIYSGAGCFIHAPSTGKQVCEESLYSSYYYTRYLEGRRILAVRN